MGVLSAQRPLQQSLALLSTDLDVSKFVNDTLGHEVGDKLLHALAQAHSQLCAWQCCVARLGGDEFAVVLDDLPGIEVASATAQDLPCGKCAGEIDGHDLTVTASIGIALFPSDGQDASALLRRADTAMYRAKKSTAISGFLKKAWRPQRVENLRWGGAAPCREAMSFAVYFSPPAPLPSLAGSVWWWRRWCAGAPRARPDAAVRFLAPGGRDRADYPHGRMGAAGDGGSQLPARGPRPAIRTCVCRGEPFAPPVGRSGAGADSVGGASPEHGIDPAYPRVRSYEKAC
ncbi:MAG: GGDEF domain-containing protein [Burkholderiales bacterium]|nr:GGDEF domain-containing protein [Burkholderiales bacterium]